MLTKKIAAIFLTMLMIFSFAGISVSAATTTQDGLEVSLTTDKTEYTKNEQITATLKVKNTNSEAVSNVTLETVVPTGFKIVDAAPSTKNIGTLSANAEDSLTIKLVKDDSGDSTIKSPKTGVMTNYAVIILLMAISGVFIVIAFKSKKKIQVLSFVLVVLMISQVVMPLNLHVSADESYKTATSLSHTAEVLKSDILINEVVNVKEEEIQINGKVVYDNFSLTGFDGSFENFNADKYDIYINTETETTFTVNVIPSQRLLRGIKVYDDQNKYVCEMNDEGINGDEVAFDGKYTGVTVLSSKEAKLVNYHAEYGSTKSEPFEICFYRDLTQEEFCSFTKLMNKITPMTFEEASIYIKSSDEVTSFDIDEINKIISFMSIYGIGGIWEDTSNSGLDNNHMKGTGNHALSDDKGIDYDSAETLINQASITPTHNNHSVIALRPFRHSEFEYDDFQDSARLIASALGGNSRVIDDENVTLSVMKSLSEYGTVLIDSHGTLKDKKTPYMLIGEELNETRFLWDPAYYLQHVSYSADYLSGRIYCTGYKNRLAVGGKFFDKYYSNNSLNDAIWFLGTCYSMYDNSISNTLTSKGAKTVFGYSQPVSVSYCNNCLFEIFTNSLIISADTTGSAFSEARRIYGTVDPYSTTVPKCELRIAGDHSYKLVDNFDIPGKGVLSGKICKASDRITPIDNATIKVYKDGRAYISKKSDSNGDYTINLPEGQYYVEIKATGYIDFHSYANVVEDENTYMETFLMVEGSENDIGTASGKIVNSLTNVGTEEVKLVFLKDWNNTNDDAETIASVTTESGGRYSVELPYGNYTVVASKEGYVTSSFNIIVQSGTTDNQNGTITPIVNSDEYLITLTWGENPRDIDSHVEGSLSNGNAFHVYYEHMNQYDGDVSICSLDYDQRYSYGPEHITLKPTTNNPIYYYIHRYEGSGTVSSSAAKITVHKGNELIATYNVPTNLGSEDYWNVFAIKDGQLIAKNTITSSPDTNYAN